MDMVGLKQIKASELKANNIICFEDWKNDLQVLKVLKKNGKMQILCKDFDKNIIEKEYECNEIIVITK